MGGLPDVIFVVDVDHEDIAITEACKLMIPVVAIVDTNSDPEGVDFVIPGNDDAIRSIRLFVSAIADAVISGKAEAQGHVSQDEFVEVVEEAETETETNESEAEAPAEDSAEAELKAEDNSPVESSEKTGGPTESATPAAE